MLSQAAMLFSAWSVLGSIILEVAFIFVTPLLCLKLPDYLRPRAALLTIACQKRSEFCGGKPPVGP
jgi:hypothetical protein